MCWLQIGILKASQGATDFHEQQRPQEHPYPSFESRLPLSHAFHQTDGTASKIGVKLDEVFDTPPSLRNPRKPELVCLLCKCVKSFARITPLWSHVISDHGDVHNDLRLHEIQRAADLWREYWEKRSDGGRRDGLTMQRIAQAARKSLTWEDVLEWNMSTN